MARYDRIAPLTTPDREQVFPGWLVLRDLEGRERDSDHARRARLRYLALRPVRRLLNSTPPPSVSSYERQIEAVREDLGFLPARDPERTRLAQYLQAIRQRTPEAVAAATLELGGACETAGHRGAAEEFYATSRELAHRNSLSAAESAALRRLGTLYASAGDAARAGAVFSVAAERSRAGGDRTGWARAMNGYAAAAAAMGETGRAVNAWRDVMEQARRGDDDAALAIGAAGLADHELEAGRPEGALELAWLALPRLNDGADRLRVLALLGLAFARLGLLAAADRCHEILQQRSEGPSPRIEARAAYACAAAEAGDAQAFRERRTALLREHGDAPAEAPQLARLHVALARGCILSGDLDFARDHLRDAMALARAHRLRDVLDRAGEHLTLLERTAQGAGPVAPVAAPGAVAFGIAAALEAYGELAPAGA